MTEQTAGISPEGVRSRVDKLAAEQRRQKAAEARSFAPALSLLEEPPAQLTSRRATGSIPWEHWRRGRLADIVRQVREHGFLVEAGPEINPKAFPAYVEYVALTLSGVHPALYGVGILRLMLAERSYLNQPKDENGRPVPNLGETCNPKVSCRKLGASKKEKGALAIRAGLSSEAIYRLNLRREAAGLLTIARSANPISKEQGPNNYGFGKDFLTEITRYIQSEGQRLAAEIVVAAFVLSKFQKNKGFAEFSRADLTTCGLGRLHFADAGLNRILSRYEDGKRVKRGLFDVIGEGRVSPPELVDLGHFKGLDAAMIWPRLEASPGSSLKVTEPVLNDHPDPRLEQSPGASRTVTQPHFEASPGGVAKGHPCERQEASELHEEKNKPQEGRNFPRILLPASCLTDGDNELREPAGVSGARAPSPSPGKAVDRWAGGLSDSSPSESDRVTQLIEVVGWANPFVAGKQLANIACVVNAIAGDLIDAGRTWSWALEQVGQEVQRRRYPFASWGDKPDGIRAFVLGCVRRESALGLGPSAHAISPTGTQASTVVSAQTEQHDGNHPSP